MSVLSGVAKGDSKTLGGSAIRVRVKSKLASYMIVLSLRVSRKVAVHPMIVRFVELRLG